MKNGNYRASNEKGQPMSQILDSRSKGNENQNWIDGKEKKPNI